MRHSTDKGGVWSLDSSTPAEMLPDEEVYETADVPAGAGAVGAFVPCSTQPPAAADAVCADGSCVSELDADGATAALARTRLRARLAAGARVFAAERYGDRLDGECFAIAALGGDDDGGCDGDGDEDEDEDTVCCPSCGNEFGHVHRRRPRSAATLVERYNRLQYEAARLEADLRRAVQDQQQQQGQQQGASVPPLGELAEQVAALTARLHTLPRDVGRASAAAAAAAAPAGACAASPSPAVEVVAPRAARAVVHDGEEVESDSEPAAGACDGSGGAEPHLPNSSGGSSSSRSVALKTLGDLDRRLAVLERTVGCRNSEAALGAAPLCETVVAWRRRLLVLTAAQLEALRGRIKEVQESLAAVRFPGDAAPAACASPAPEAASATAAAGEGSGSGSGSSSGSGLTVHELAQVQRVLENMERWERTRQALPEIVERLRTLAPLHEASASFAEQLDDVERRQQAAQHMLDDMQLVVVRLEQSLALSTRRLADNVQALEARLAPPPK